jgi:hypothetical protein
LISPPVSMLGLPQVIEPQQPIQRPVHVGHKERLRPVAA